MKRKTALWLARIICLIWAAFWAWFGLVSGSEGYGGGIEGIIKNSPNALPGAAFLLITWLAWKKPQIGGMVLIVIGAIIAFGYPIMASNFALSVIIMMELTFALPPLLVGGLFLWGSRELRMQEIITFLKGIEGHEAEEAICQKLNRYDEILSRLTQLKDINNEDLPEIVGINWQDQDINQRNILKQLAHKNDERDSLTRDIISLENEIVALYCFVKELEYTEIEAIIRDFTSWRQTDILTCRGWISCHHKMIANNEIAQQKLYKPFQCEVGPPSAQKRLRHNVDREFQSLRDFLPFYNEKMRIELRFFQKNENPDFILINSSNKANIGLEVTDANVDANYPKQHAKRSDFFQRIYHELNISHVFWVVPCNPMKCWRGKENEVFSVFQNKVAPYYHGGNKEIKTFELFGIWIDVGPGKMINLSEDRKLRPMSSNGFDLINANSICYKIKEKVGRKEKPTIRPCILLINPLIEEPIDNHDAVIGSIIENVSDLAINNYYDEVWYTYQKGGYRVL